MPKANLGLFDTPPTRGETQIGLAIVGSLLAAVLLIIPIINRQVGEIQAFVPAINSAIFVGELIIATMLYAQAAIFRSRGLTILASAYVFTALLLVPYIMTFPGVFFRERIIGSGAKHGRLADGVPPPRLPAGGDLLHAVAARRGT